MGGGGTVVVAVASTRWIQVATVPKCTSTPFGYCVTVHQSTIWLQNTNMYTKPPGRYTVPMHQYTSALGDCSAPVCLSKARHQFEAMHQYTSLHQCKAVVVVVQVGSERACAQHLPGLPAMIRPNQTLLLITSKSNPSGILVLDNKQTRPSYR